MGNFGDICHVGIKLKMWSIVTVLIPNLIRVLMHGSTYADYRFVLRLLPCVLEHYY